MQWELTLIMMGWVQHTQVGHYRKRVHRTWRSPALLPVDPNMIVRREHVTLAIRRDGTETRPKVLGYWRGWRRADTRTRYETLEDMLNAVRYFEGERNERVPE